MIEQVLRIALKFAIGLQRQTLPEARRGALVQLANVHVRASRAAGDLVRGELVAPTQRVPDAGIVGSHRGRALETREAFAVLTAPRDQRRAKVLQRLDVVRIDGQRSARQFDAACDIACFVTRARLVEQGPRLVRCRQPSASTSLSSSCSVNTRNEAVRTLPWLLTDIETRDMVSSSGASAITT